MRRAEQFIQLKPHEEIVTIVREYFIMQTVPLAIGGLAYLALLFFIYPLLRLGGWGVLAWLVGISVTLLYSGRRIYLWYYEVCIITNQRCVDIQRPGLFARQVQEIPWGGVTDVVFSQRGIWATIFKFGTVTLQLEGDRVLTLQHVYLPDKLRDILAEHVEKLH